MTKKDYNLIAKSLREFRVKADTAMLPGEVDNCIARDLIVPLARELKADNPAFNYGLFLAACGVKPMEAE